MNFELAGAKAQSGNRKHFALKAAAVLGLVGFLFPFQPLRAQAGPSGYRVVKTIPIGGDGGWDYCLVDSDARRIYVTHATHVVVLDADSNAVVGDIPNTPGPHGVALAPDLGRGFISNGRGNSVTIFDMKTLQTINTVPIEGKNPDAIYYDVASKRVFTFNGGSANSSVISATDGTVVGNFPVGGRPEFATGAGDGRIFLNIEDKSELLQIDAQKLAVVHRWPIAPCKEPSGLAMDTQNNRLFAVCGNHMMAIVNGQTGKVVATPKIDEDPDAAGFDPQTQMVFSSNGGSGTLTVIHEDSPDKYSLIENVPTKKYARTMAIDFKTHNIYLPIAEFEPATPKGEGHPPMKANSFAILLVGK